MRRVYQAMLLLPLLVLIGCGSSSPMLKPPPEPAVFRQPPDDPRYQREPQFPAHLLNQDRVVEEFDPRRAMKSNMPLSRGSGMR